MGSATENELPKELDSFFRKLRSEPCSLNWDWRKILELLQSGSRHTSAFYNLFEAGIYHLLHVKEIKKNSTIKCKSWRRPTLETANLAGASFAFLMCSGAISKRNERFRETLKQIVYSISDSVRCCLETSGFSPEAVQALTAFQEHAHGLQHLIPLDSGITDTSVRSQVAFCRTELLCSALRSVFEWGSSSCVPVCAPLISTLTTAILSVNCCDPRYASSELLSCFTRLLHSFSVIPSSFGGILLPSVPAILTGLVYQLEWNSVLLKSQPSAEVILFRLSVYRALSSSACNASYFSSTAVRRLFARLSVELCGDLSSITDLLSTHSNCIFENSVAPQDLRMCIVVAALLLIEHLFAQVPSALITYLKKDDAIRENFGDECPSQKLKSSLIHLTSMLSEFVRKLTHFMNSASSVSSPHLLRPHLLISVLRVIGTLTSHSSFSFDLSAYRNFVQLVLCHEDLTVRTYARNVYSKCLQPLTSVYLQVDKDVLSPKSVLTSDAFVQTSDLSLKPDTCCQSTEVHLCCCSQNSQPAYNYKHSLWASETSATTGEKRCADDKSGPLPKKPHLAEPQTCSVELVTPQTAVTPITHMTTNVADENPPVEDLTTVSVDSPVIPWPGGTLFEDHAEEEYFDEVWAPRLPEDNDTPDVEVTNKQLDSEALAEWSTTDDQKAPRRRRRRRHQKIPPLGSKPINAKAYFRPFTVYPSKRDEPVSTQTLPGAIRS